jgi:hypothetical protein
MAFVRQGCALALSLTLWAVAALAEDQAPPPPTGLYDRPVLVVDAGMHNAIIKSAAADRDGHWAVTGSEDKTVRVWLLADGAFDRTSPPPSGRSVLMVARIVTKMPIGGVAREFPAQDPGARVPGGRVHAIRINDPNFLEVATWNTGRPSDLRETGNRSHAEKQFYEFVQDKAFSQVEIEISHSPCTACCDLLAGLLRGQKVPAILRWGQPYEWGVQATNRQALTDLLKVEWKLAAPASAIPGDALDLPIGRL